MNEKQKFLSKQTSNIFFILVNPRGMSVVPSLKKIIIQPIAYTMKVNNKKI